MDIEIYTVRELDALLREKAFWFQNVAPITRHRAQLLVANPRAQHDDAVLFVAKDKGEIIGYRIVYPDTVYPAGEPLRIGWGSAFWVSEQRRGEGVGRLLFQKSLEVWGGSIGSLIQSRDAARVYEGNKSFYCFQETVGYQFVVRLNTLYWVRKRVRIPSGLDWVFAPLDFVFNGVSGLRRRLWAVRRKSLENFRLEYCREIVDSEAVEFVQNHNQHSLSRKTVADLNAIVRYPTSLATPFTDVITSRYYFAIKSHRFDYLYFKIYDLKLNLIAVVLLNLDGDTLKLLYYFCSSEEVLPHVFDIVLLHALRLKTEVIVSYDVHFNDHILKSGFPRLFARQQIRKSFLPLKFRDLNFQRLKTYDGDGA
ncbi:MAG TPA: GNAT family N-acetyltransferase [Cyclobacteriaceae bacterium]|nr:GNAT family N-acetyltransferase [Cyclobacteriaceae bacterium]